MDLAAFSSTIIASSSADDNRITMNSGACTVMSKLGGLVLKKSPCSRFQIACGYWSECTLQFLDRLPDMRYLYAIHYASWMD